MNNSTHQHTSIHGANCCYSLIIAQNASLCNREAHFFMIERFLNSDLFAFLLFAAIIYITVRLIRHYRYHGSDVKYFRIYAGVHDLEQIVKQLEQLEEIQTSIELARFHRLRGVTITMPDNLSHDHDHTLIVNGHDKNSKMLMALVISERDRLRKQLERKITELDKHGTTQLNPVGVTKELAEVATMRSRGAHFSPLPPAENKNSELCTVHNKTDDLSIIFTGEEEPE